MDTVEEIAHKSREEIEHVGGVVVGGLEEGWHLVEDEVKAGWSGRVCVCCIGLGAGAVLETLDPTLYEVSADGVYCFPAGWSRFQGSGFGDSPPPC
jgi:hypothetical protein